MVNAYQMQFEMLWSLVVAKHSHLDEEYFLSLCIKGLKEEIGNTVQSFWPSSVDAVFSIARVTESLMSYEAGQSSTFGFPTMATSSSGDTLENIYPPIISSTGSTLVLMNPVEDVQNGHFLIPVMLQASLAHMKDGNLRSMMVDLGPLVDAPDGTTEEQFVLDYDLAKENMVKLRDAITDSGDGIQRVTVVVLLQASLDGDSKFGASCPNVEKDTLTNVYDSVKCSALVPSFDTNFLYDPGGRLFHSAFSFGLVHPFVKSSSFVDYFFITHGEAAPTVQSPPYQYLLLETLQVRLARRMSNFSTVCAAPSLSSSAADGGTVVSKLRCPDNILDQGGSIIHLSPMVHAYTKDEKRYSLDRTSASLVQLTLEHKDVAASHKRVFSRTLLHRRNLMVPLSAVTLLLAQEAALLVFTQNQPCFYTSKATNSYSIIVEECILCYDPGSIFCPNHEKANKGFSRVGESDISLQVSTIISYLVFVLVSGSISQGEQREVQYKRVVAALCLQLHILWYFIGGNGKHQVMVVCPVSSSLLCWTLIC